MFLRKLLAGILSVLALIPGWLGATGVSLLVAFVPLLYISSLMKDTKRDWWEVLGWAFVTFVAWNFIDVWWLTNATMAGAMAAMIGSALFSLIGFMIFHTVSKRAPKVLSYTVLVSAWIAIEYMFMLSDLKWPWLQLGNGFSNDIWAIQWYEYTGGFGGALWVLIANIAVYEALVARRSVAKWLFAASVIVVPLLISIFIYNTFEEQSDMGSVEISVIQPNADCYALFNNTEKIQEGVLLDLLAKVPSTTDIVVMPETALPRQYWESTISTVPMIKTLSNVLGAVAPDATLISGAHIMVPYEEGEQSETARQLSNGWGYYDNFNSIITLDAERNLEYRHKARLVPGVEDTPSWVIRFFKIFVFDVGGFAGQIGRGVTGNSFDVNGVGVGGAICYEAMFGNFMGEFVRSGAEVMTIVSNDGWWGDTAGHRHLYSFSALRAVESRRAIARSANTGISGFIDARGDSLEELGWDERGILTHRLNLSDRMTVYTLYGDYIARVACYIAILSLLYYAVYRKRKKHHLVD